ncbi:YcxB family protein [Hyphomicrobium sulfonivorans]|uniref:YcxB family protein n=1 Tax=Hyphomicrobium sulfonivorans TaxID=121290 RepID=UPI00156DF2F3|nr:YcxB family protein [Hyphomicrobium sulfonivorans]MBI1650485.1 hypothetical protein [Hyphomicrobium sulfonivorans]NSL72156.1 hypothetical protein [Hyphomicrobium sulfonivorans]
MATLEANGVVSTEHWRELVRRANERVKRRVWKQTAAVGIFVTAVFFSLPFLLSERFGYDFESLLLGLIFGLGVWWLYQTLACFFIASHWLKRDGVLLGPSRVTVGDVGVISEGRHTRSEYDWTMMEDVQSYAKIIVIWTDPGSGILIPRNAFAAPELERAFIEQIKFRIEAARREHVR